MAEHHTTLVDQFLGLFRDLKGTVEGWSGEPWFAWVLFAILFIETGLVIMPFLPGDSLLFVVGAIVAGGKSRVSLAELLAIMSVAAILGDAVNYSIGKWLGPAVFKSETSKLLNKRHLVAAQAFYEKYGGKAIVLARFVPIVRTFAPFVAGIGRMNYARFAMFNVVGGIGWVVSLTMAGYFFGTIPWVEKHFESVVVAIVVISVIPVAIEYLRARRAVRG